VVAGAEAFFTAASVRGFLASVELLLDSFRFFVFFVGVR